MTTKEFFHLIERIRRKGMPGLDPEIAKVLPAKTKNSMVRYLVKNEGLILKELVTDQSLEFIKKKGYFNTTIKHDNELYFPNHKFYENDPKQSG